MKNYLLLLAFVWSLFDLKPAQAAAVSIAWTGEMPIYRLQDSPDLQRLIDETFQGLFQTSLLNQLCSYSVSASEWQSTFAVSQQVVENSLKACRQIKAPKKKTSAFPAWPFQGELQPKKYFLVLDTHKKSLVQSWTDTRNNTFFMLDQDLSIQDLHLMIAHEIAMTLDSKNNMDMRTFSYLEGVGPTYDMGFNFENMDLASSPVFQVWQSTEGGPRIQERTLVAALSKVMNLASTSRYSRVFSVMRALNTEKILMGETPPSTIDHQACVNEFMTLSNAFDNQTLSPVLEGHKSLWDQYKQSIDEQYAIKNPNLEARIRSLMMDANFVLPISRKPRFCQYMATPLLTGIKLNMYSSGPRPRFTGGTGTTDDDKPLQDPRKESTRMESIRKGKALEFVKQLSPIKSAQDIPPLEQDFLKYLNLKAKDTP